MVIPKQSKINQIHLIYKHKYSVISVFIIINKSHINSSVVKIQYKKL